VLKLRVEQTIRGVMNHLKQLFSVALAAAFLAGCAETPEVTTWRDPLTNQQTDLISNNELPTPGVLREIIWFNAARVPVKGQYKIYLEVLYGANKEAGYLEIYPGRTLTVLADGQELRFTGLGGEKREDKNIVYENARYEAKVSDIETIANASKVTILLQGKDSLIERSFGPENFARFKQFAEKIHGTGQAAVAPNFKGM
jgi:hypothetical protein